MNYNLDKIKKDVKKVISYTQNIDNPKIDNLIDTWYEKKKYFIELFGDKLIYTSPNKMVFGLSNEVKNTKINQFIDSIRFNYNFPELADFIEMNKEGFFSNSVVKEYKLPSGEIIPEGMKLLKSFKFFIENKDYLYHIQNMASAIIQEDKVEGYLCISVHPLDFLSSSENNYNWRSCHALDGEYRAGNLSYMLDSCTTICYLRSDEEKVYLDNFGGIRWNSKKWRMLLYFSDNHKLFFAGRQYPFQSEGALEIITSHILSPLLKKSSSAFSAWTNETIDEYKIGGRTIVFPKDSYIVVNNNIMNKYDIIKDQSKLHYNDLLFSTCYKPYYSYIERPSIKKRNIEDYKFEVGSKVMCLECGCNYIEDSEWMTCDGCHEYDHYFYCDSCGCRVYEEDDWCWLDNGERLCWYCFNDVGAFCECCGEADYADNMCYNEDEEAYYCQYCWNNRRE